VDIGNRTGWVSKVQACVCEACFIHDTSAQDSEMQLKLENEQNSLENKINRLIIDKRN